jgi:hypothetical protein
MSKYNFSIEKRNNSLNEDPLNKQKIWFLNSVAWKVLSAFFCIFGFHGLSPVNLSNTNFQGLPGEATIDYGIDFLFQLQFKRPQKIGQPDDACVSF